MKFFVLPIFIVAAFAAPQFDIDQLLDDAYNAQQNFITHPGCGVFQFFKIAMPGIPLEDVSSNILNLGPPKT